MPKIISDFVKGYVFRLSEDGYSYTSIIKICKEKNVHISKFAISKIIIDNKENFDSGSKKDVFGRKPKDSSRSLTPIAKKVAQYINKENPMSQRNVAARLNISQSTVNRIIKTKLNLKMRKKTKVHVLSQKHIKERKTKCRKLYENHLAGQKWKYIVTLDEAWIYLNDCNQPRAIYYVKNEFKGVKDWVKQCRERFSKGFMVVAGFCAQGKLRIRRVDNKIKINSEFYQREILQPIFDEEIPFLYQNDKNKVWIHQDQAPSHTSRSTLNYLFMKQEETGISAIPYSRIPAKSPDTAPMDFCAFGLLKQKMRTKRPTTLEGLWKACLACWEEIEMPILIKSLISWKYRCRYIVKCSGHHIEHKKYLIK